MFNDYIIPYGSIFAICKSNSTGQIAPPYGAIWPGGWGDLAGRDFHGKKLYWLIVNYRLCLCLHRVFKYRGLIKKKNIHMYMYMYFIM